jgi:hypothetical protein
MPPARARPTSTGQAPELTTALIESGAAARRLRLACRMGAADREMEVEPWAVVLRHSRWYLPCRSHTRQERRVLRVDRIVAIEILPATFTPPDDLDALRVLEEHLSQGWTYPVDVLVYATVEEAATWLPRSLARLEPDGDRTRLRATTNDPDWYARQLARIPAPFAVLGSMELRRATSGPKQAATAGRRGTHRRRGRAGSAECLRHRGHLGRVRDVGLGQREPGRVGGGGLRGRLAGQPREGAPLTGQYVPHARDSRPGKHGDRHGTDRGKVDRS